MTTLINNETTFTPSTSTEKEVKCGYCGSTNCGALYGDPICHELPIPEQKDMLGLE